MPWGGRQCGRDPLDVSDSLQHDGLGLMVTGCSGGAYVLPLFSWAVTMLTARAQVMTSAWATLSHASSFLWLLSHVCLGGVCPCLQ